MSGSDKQAANPNRPGSIGDAEKAAIVSEVQRLYSRLTPSATSTTMNAASSIAIGAGAIAATQVPEAFVIIPILWTTWLFHSLILDLEALKDSAHLRWLETIANQALDVRILVSETALTRRANRRRPLVFYASFSYTALLAVGTWVAATWILVERERPWWAAAAGILAAVVIFVGAWTAARRSTYSDDYETRLPSVPGAGTG